MQDTKEKAVLSQGRSLSRKYLRWNRSHAGKKSGRGGRQVFQAEGTAYVKAPRQD